MKIKAFLIIIILPFLLGNRQSSPDRIPYSKIIEKYKGNLIYVDMWASWCKPCRSEIKKMKKIKEKYPNIVYLYITMDLDREACAKAIKKDGIIDESKNYFIIDIIKDEKYNEIKSDKSIPHYLLYNEKGELVNTNAPRPSNKELIIELDKYLKH
ncbi:redoxin domain-containing protein [Flavobacterium jejuense]|uniref:Redoxin domain-containing protein n=1 Tax=Flavobacterium jejuense TaxID=1544455 RepID=A0ABX0ISJ8_9FLAO|nr:thioredoxin-like domain-containing protein [Flavobacterium jejuense]NHN26678.1 redoxin domain-containing protein [Flavobacterium jejuense]